MKTRQQRWIYHEVVELSSRAGISAPEIKIVGLDPDAEDKVVEVMRRFPFFRPTTKGCLGFANASYAQLSPV
jgi:hypothetical protein